jgi:ATP-dependent RNA helicase DeaD
VETEENEERGSGRSQNVVHTLPRSMASVPQFLTGPLERVDPAAGATQVVVITPDAETAVALAEAVLRMTGPGGIELLPVTTARRASRLIAGRPIAAIAGSARDIRDLVKGSQIKLDSIKSVVLAWADEILSGEPDEIEALEAVMSELPKDAARVVVTSRSEGRVNAFAERYLRRARRDADPVADEAAEPVTVQYVIVANSARTSGLRRLLDDLDPPSAAIIVTDDESVRAASGLLRSLGYHEGSAAVKVSRGEIEPSTYAVIFYDAPSTRSQLTAAVAATPVTIISLVDPRELSTLRRVAGGEVKPFTLTATGNAARDRDAAIRRDLSTVLDSGLASREVLALEPLLERHDGIEIAAAALRLLEKERILRRALQEEARAQREAPPARESFERRPPPPRGADRGERSDRGGDRGERRPSFGPRKEGGRDFSRGGDKGGARPPREGGREGGGPPKRPPFGRSEGGRPPRRDRP